MGRPSRVCKVEGCRSPHSSLGYCSTHYMRWRRTGDPLRSRKRTSLPADTLARLRQTVGIPEEGPTPDLVDRWRAQESGQEEVDA